MAGAKKRTLLQAVNPFLLLLNLLYGLNLGNRKRPGCVRRLRKGLHKHWVWLLFLFAFYFYCDDKYNKAGSVHHTRYIYLTNVFCCSFRLFAFNEPEMEQLMRRLKQHQTGVMSERASRRMIKVFLFTLALIPLSLAKLVLNIITSIARGTVDSNSNLQAIYFLFGASYFYLHAFLGILFELTVLIFPILLGCLCCMLVMYGPSRLDDHIEDIRSTHSPLRRARLLSRMCQEYYRLQPLASMTNRSMATIMSMLKILTMLLWVVCIKVLEEKKPERLFIIPVLQYSIPLLMYLRVAPSANSMQCKVFEAAAEVLMVDDQWPWRDPISRSPLIKMRLNLLQHLVHMAMDQGPFTLLGDSVDPETFFTIFVEANDLRTTL